jgi:cell wall-associated NlpC family hydrolase
VAIQAAVSRQQTFVKLTKGKRNKLAGERAAAAAGPSGSSQVPAWAGGSGASASQGDIAANWALSQLGKPYQWGGAGPARYDCSGLTMVAWAHAGVQLLHYTGYQWQEGPHVPLGQLRRGAVTCCSTPRTRPTRARSTTSRSTSATG